MTRLATMIYSMSATVLASVAVVAALVSGVGSTAGLLGAAAAGAILAVPTAWAIVRKMTGG